MPASVGVICTFLNADQTLQPTLESLRAQATADAKFIFVDDGSHDGGAAIVETFCARDPRFILVTNPKPGRSRALNFGVRQVDAEHIAILDADDVAHPAWLSDGLATMRRLPEFTVIGFERTVLRDLEAAVWADIDQTDAVRLADVSRRLARGNVIGHSGAIIRKKRLVEVGGYDEARPHLVDYDLWIRLVKAGYRIGRNDLVRIGKRYHADQKFNHRPGMRKASLLMQLRAVMAIDRSAGSFATLAWVGVREFSREPRRAIAGLSFRR
jgi:glycosyltransferase involved in cell wall biosynthesis